MAKWKLMNVRSGMPASQQDRHGNTALISTAAVVIYGGVVNTNRIVGRIIIYASERGYSAYRTGITGEEVTDQLPLSRWADLYTQAVGAHALLGRVPDSFWQEII